MEKATVADAGGKAVKKAVEETEDGEVGVDACFSIFIGLRMTFALFVV